MAVLPIRNLNQQNALTAGQLQPTAQANVPVIPNNGNPAGANNMPGALAPKASIPSFFQYSVSNPSPYMQTMASLLGGVGQPVAPSAPPVGVAPAVPTQAAVLPLRAAVEPADPNTARKFFNGAPPVVPMRRGV